MKQMYKYRYESYIKGQLLTCIVSSLQGIPSFCFYYRDVSTVDLQGAFVGSMWDLFDDPTLKLCDNNTTVFCRYRHGETDRRRSEQTI